MTDIGKRIEREREVLSTLLLRNYAYRELPGDFSIEDFETHDYRDLFNKYKTIFIDTGQSANFVELGKVYPELGNLIIDVTYPPTVLNGTLKERAAALKNHNPQGYVNETRIKSNYTEQKKDEKGFRFKLLNGMEIHKMEIPEQSFLIKNLLSEQSVNFLSGEEGCGKSILAMNIAISIAIGVRTWLAFDITKQGKVLYLNNELAFTDFARRHKKMCDSLPARGDISNLIIPKEVPALNDCWDTLNETCEREKPCLIVVDCLYFTHNKDENDSSQMKALMRQFLTLRDRFHLALLLVHHTKKGARYQQMHNDQMRGSNVFGGVTDTVLQFRRSASDESKRIIKPTKFRHVSDDYRKCRLLSLNPETLWFKDEGETDEGEHIATPELTAEQQIDFKEIYGNDKELSRKEILERCKPLGYDERTIDRQLKRAKEKGILKVPRYGDYAL
jgi:hypothetical protein